ncbi:hypothetical protein DFS34DRAFT_388414 [Phlyctochytrium arcticum]|nr:hypothetical protein DFS34DRAFT_388414 [Phlyctochytrium arcticum]
MFVAHVPFVAFLRKVSSVRLKVIENKMGAILHGRRSNLVAYLLFLLFAVGNVYAQTPTTTATPTATPEGGGGGDYTSPEQCPCDV